VIFQFCYGVFRLNVLDTIMMTFQLTWCDSRWLWHKCVCCIAQCIILTFFKRCCWAWCYFAANLLRYMCAKNYYNIAWFDKLMAKIKWCSFLPHSVLCNNERTIQISDSETKSSPVFESHVQCHWIMQSQYCAQWMATTAAGNKHRL